MSVKEFQRSSLDSLSQESGRVGENTPFVYHVPVADGQRYRHGLLVSILTIALLVSCTGWAWTCVVLSPRAATASATSQSILKPMHWNTPYSGTNKSLTNDLWKNLFPRGQGLVALSNTEAMRRRLPASVKHGSNASESVYFVSAYHQIHCLSVIRAALYHFSEGVDQTVPLVHTLHCLDSLRQEVMCHADSDLLYTEDGKIFGDGQVRECKDWDKLRSWTEHRKIY